MPEMDEISDSDDENENTLRREKYLFHMVDYDSGNMSDLEEVTESDDKAKIENEVALLNFSAVLRKAQKIATSSVRNKEQGTRVHLFFPCIILGFCMHFLAVQIGLPFDEFISLGA